MLADREAVAWMNLEPVRLKAIPEKLRIGLVG
jgi:hypothetical protein